MKEETLRSMESAGQREDAGPGLKIPRPTFIVLYNGTEEIPDKNTYAAVR